MGTFPQNFQRVLKCIVIQFLVWDEYTRTEMFPQGKRFLQYWGCSACETYCVICKGDPLRLIVLSVGTLESVVLRGRALVWGKFLKTDFWRNQPFQSLIKAREIYIDRIYGFNIMRGSVFSYQVIEKATAERRQRQRHSLKVKAILPSHGIVFTRLSSRFNKYLATCDHFKQVGGIFLSVHSAGIH